MKTAHTTHDGNSPGDLPGSCFVDPRSAVLDKVAEKAVRKLYRCVMSGKNERELDLLIRANPVIFGLASGFFCSGHKGCWVFPQKVLRPRGVDGTPGLIPDYLIASRDSDGLTWWVVEMKSPAEAMYVEREGYVLPSSAHAKGIAQLQEYLDWCDSHASYLREGLGMKDFSRPYGVLLIGRGAELEKSEARRKAKQAYNRSHSAIRVRTWDAFLRAIWCLSVEGDYWAFLRTLDINIRLAQERDAFEEDEL